MGTLAIIGGGASGALLALQALRQGGANLEITVIDPTPGPLGTGMAYATEDPLHLLNVPARRMSAIPSEPDSFVRWSGESPLAYAPRRRYGRYLSELLRETAARAPGKLTHLRERAIAVDAPGADGLARVRFESGREFRASRVALAMGPPQAARTPEAFATLKPGEEFFNQVWSSSGVVELPRDARVLILGTGLTMVDVALSLVSRSHRGKITALSRRGLLPQTQLVHRGAPPEPRAPSFAPGASLSAVARELIRTGRESAASPGDWRPIVDGIRPMTDAIWAGFSAKEKSRFLRHLRPYWDSHRHRMPPESAGRLAEIVSWRKVDVIAGRALSSKRLRRAIQVEIFNRALGTPAKLDVDAILACMGPPGDLAQNSQPLVSDLLASGLARLDPTRLGFECGIDGRLLTARGNPSPWLFALGALRRGQLWETTAIPEIRGQAERLAALLAGDLR